MQTLWVVGLGVFLPQMSQETAAILSGGATVILQTERCYLTSWLREKGLAFTCMDAMYDSAEDFDALNRNIAQLLLTKRKENQGDLVYAVPGCALGLPIIEALYREMDLDETGQDFLIAILPGTHYADTALAAAAGRKGFSGGAQVYFADELGNIDTRRVLCLEELDTRFIAGQAKLALQAYYPSVFRITIAFVSGQTYQLKEIPLYELDQQSAALYAHHTCVLIPVLPFEKKEHYDFNDLKEIIRRLRAPDGCPWDREQTHESIRADLLEEAYEVVEAIDRQDAQMLEEELGDLLMQIFFHAIMGEEMSAFDLRDVTTGICRKLIYRHPHVFGDTNVNNAEEVLENWDALKRLEKAQESYTDTLQAVPKPLPALTRAVKLQKKAAKAGFDWENAEGALEKASEESQEYMVEWEKISRGENNRDELAEEMGDWLFSLVNVARLSGLDPEFCLMAANEKFLRRFSRMEENAEHHKKSLDECSMDELNVYWEQAKAVT